MTVMVRMRRVARTAYCQPTAWAYLSTGFWTAERSDTVPRKALLGAAGTQTVHGSVIQRFGLLGRAVE